MVMYTVYIFFYITYFDWVTYQHICEFNIWTVFSDIILHAIVFFFFFFFTNHPIIFTTAECPLALQTHGIVFPFVQYGVSHSICMDLPWKHLTPFPAIIIIILIILIITSIAKYSIMEAKESEPKISELNWVVFDCNGRSLSLYGCIKLDLALA